MREYKKSYVGLIIWLIVFCFSSFVPCFLPIKNIQILTAIFDNIWVIGIFILTLVIYLTESIYWYNGISFEQAKQAGSERRKRFSLSFMKRFGYFAVCFLAYSIASVLLKLPFGIDITVATLGIVIVAISTIKIKL